MSLREKRRNLSPCRPIAAFLLSSHSPLSAPAANPPVPIPAPESDRAPARAWGRGIPGVKNGREAGGERATKRERRKKEAVCRITFVKETSIGRPFTLRARWGRASRRLSPPALCSRRRLGALSPASYSTRSASQLPTFPFTHTHTQKKEAGLKLEFRKASAPPSFPRRLPFPASLPAAFAQLLSR